MSELQPAATLWLRDVFERNSARVQSLPPALREARFSTGNKSVDATQGLENKGLATESTPFCEE